MTITEDTIRVAALDARVRKVRKTEMSTNPQMSRRTTLAMLGLAPTTAVGAESFMGASDKKGHPETGSASGRQIATALRRLADSIEDGSAPVEQIDLQTRLSAGDLVRHTLELRFWYAPGPEA